MLREIDFPKELIVNASRENLIAVLKERQKPIAGRMEEVKWDDMP
jgi:putative hydrolase